MIAFTVLVGKKRAVVGFREPSFRIDVGKGENALADGEVRIASHCIAVLGQRENSPYLWPGEHSRASAEFIASCIPKARVGVVRVKGEKGDKRRSAR
jgi:hypothetical protein